MTIRFLAIDAATTWALRTGNDAYGRPAETAGLSTGVGTPCRHCLRQVPAGQPYLVMAHRPFTALHPYTETGPIFLCADDCTGAGFDFPAAILTAPHYIVRGYDANERIIYGTGAVIPTNAIMARCEQLFIQDQVAFIHIRSASNNCFLCRVDRARPENAGTG